MNKYFNDIKSVEPFILLSFINMKLRDYYVGLYHLCDDLNINQDDVENILLSIGYKYYEKYNQFKKIE